MSWDTAREATASQHLWFSRWLQAVCEGLGTVRGDGNSPWGWGSGKHLFTARKELQIQKP